MTYRKKLGVLALVLALVLTLSGCMSLLDTLLGARTVAYEDMEYTRPDLHALDQALDQVYDTLETGGDAVSVMEAVNAYYILYNRFYTDYALADIRYNCDMTDLYWDEEYRFCAESSAEAEAGLENMLHALAASPLRQELEEDYFGEGFFDEYQGEIIWDETFTALMEQESRLTSRYYELSSQALETEYYSEEYFSVYGVQMEALLVELVALRQQIAAYTGYGSYPEFAYDMYYSRDYTPAQTESYLLAVGDTLSDLYGQVGTGAVWELSYGAATEEQTFRYVETAASNMGGEIYSAFRLLKSAGLYHIGYGPNKFDGAYETYLWSYEEPFIFMNPSLTQYDKLSFSHEFGHFVNDYVCWGSGAGPDVAEVQSQAMEYLCLFYGEDTDALRTCKMADSLCTYVEQAAYGLFEQQLYALEGEDLTVENIRALYGQIGSQFGFDFREWDFREYVTVSHFYISPLYIPSYVVSNDVAMQICQQEKAQRGLGLETYLGCVESGESHLLAFAESNGLESPFAPGRLEQVEKTFREELADWL